MFSQVNALRCTSALNRSHQNLNPKAKSRRNAYPSFENSSSALGVALPLLCSLWRSAFLCWSVSFNFFDVFVGLA